MLVTAVFVYALRVISGTATLLMVFLLARYYGIKEIAEYALFMFLFNMGTVLAVFGNNVTVVDEINKRALNSEANYRVPVVVYFLDGALVSTLMAAILIFMGGWNPGLMAIIPASIAAVFAAALINYKKPIAGVFFLNFTVQSSRFRLQLLSWH